MEGYSEFRIRIRFMLLSTIHVYPYNKTRHSYIYMLPKDGWTEWAEIFCGHSCLRVKKSQIFFPRATPGPLARIS